MLELWERLTPVMARKGLTPSDKLVAVGLCRFIDRKGVCWPSIGALEDQTGLSERQVRRSLDELVRAGAIERRARYSEDGRQRSNLYRFLTPKDYSSREGVPDCPRNGFPPEGDALSETLPVCRGGGKIPSGGGCIPDGEEGDELSGRGVADCHPELDHKELDHKELRGKERENALLPAISGPGEPTAAVLMRLFAARCPGLPVPGKVTKRRKAAVRRVIRSSPERMALAWWEEVFDRVAGSEFLNGGGTRRWKACYDWLMEEEHLEKLLSGLYDDSSPKRPRGRKETLREYVDRMTKEAGLDGTDADATGDAPCGWGAPGEIPDPGPGVTPAGSPMDGPGP